MLTIPSVRPIVVLFIYCYYFSYQTTHASDLRIREDSKLFVRMNIKINSLEHTRIFAYAIGFRINFDLRKSRKSKLLHTHNGLVTAQLHPESIRQTALFLLNSYGWNGTACLTRVMCDISTIPKHPGDIFGPIMKLLLFGSQDTNTWKNGFCHDAKHCPISILDLAFGE